MKLSYKRLTLPVPLSALRRLKGRMRYVRAAGGLVVDEGGEVLLIRRNDRWDLPKGKVEPGESLRQAALREVAEETGIRAHCGPLLVKTYHLYDLYGGWHLKQTSWFVMRAEGRRPEASPQAEEGIERCEWCPQVLFPHRMSRSYGTMHTILRQWTHSRK